MRGFGEKATRAVLAAAVLLLFLVFVGTGLQGVASADLPAAAQLDQSEEGQHGSSWDSNSPSDDHPVAALLSTAHGCTGDCVAQSWAQLGPSQLGAHPPIAHLRTAPKTSPPRS